MSNLFPLGKDFSARAGTMVTVRAGCHTGWWSFAIVDPGVRWPSATVKNLGGRLASLDEGISNHAGVGGARNVVGGRRNRVIETLYSY